MKLIGTLNKLGNQANESVGHINAGGCCVYAAAIATHLQHVCKKVRVLVGDNDTWRNSIPKVRNQVAANTPSEWNNNGIQFGHVIVEFEYRGRVYHYDSNGVTKKADRTATLGYKLLKGALTIQEATELGNCARGWNYHFLRNDIPRLHNMIDEHLSPLWAR
jgi:hypothetical protein